jgi:uncharacterized protein YbcV (DUF1398 family)
LFHLADLAQVTTRHYNGYAVKQNHSIYLQKYSDIPTYTLKMMQSFGANMEILYLQIRAGMAIGYGNHIYVRSC